MGNLALTNSCNQLTISNIHKMSTCRLFEKFTATSRQRLGQPQNKEVSPKGRLERARAAARSPREDQALLLRGPLPLVPRAVSPHRGNLVALSLSFIIEGRCLQAVQRHGPRRIAQHPEQSGPFAAVRRCFRPRKTRGTSKRFFSLSNLQGTMLIRRVIS